MTACSVPGCLVDHGGGGTHTTHRAVPPDCCDFNALAQRVEALESLTRLLEIEQDQFETQVWQRVAGLERAEKAEAKLLERQEQVVRDTGIITRLNGLLLEAEKERDEAVGLIEEAVATGDLPFAIQQGLDAFLARLDRRKP